MGCGGDVTLMTMMTLLLLLHTGHPWFRAVMETFLWFVTDTRSRRSRLDYSTCSSGGTPGFLLLLPNRLWYYGWET